MNFNITSLSNILAFVRFWVNKEYYRLADLLPYAVNFIKHLLWGNWETKHILNPPTSAQQTLLVACMWLFFSLSFILIFYRANVFKKKTCFAQFWSKMVQEPTTLLNKFSCYDEKKKPTCFVCLCVNTERALKDWQAWQRGKRWPPLHAPVCYVSAQEVCVCGKCGLTVGSKQMHRKAKANTFDSLFGHFLSTYHLNLACKPDCLGVKHTDAHYQRANVSWLMKHKTNICKNSSRFYSETEQAPLKSVQIKVFELNKKSQWWKIYYLVFILTVHFTDIYSTFASLTPSPTSRVYIYLLYFLVSSPFFSVASLVSPFKRSLHSPAPLISAPFNFPYYHFSLSPLILSSPPPSLPYTP